MLLPNGGTIMRVFTTSIAALAAAFAVATVAQAQEIKRTEIKRSDLTGTNMEVIMTVLEAPPGDRPHRGQGQAAVGGGEVDRIR
jgi:hypothetical protein